MTMTYRILDSDNGDLVAAGPVPENFTGGVRDYADGRSAELAEDPAYLGCLLEVNSKTASIVRKIEARE